MAFFRIFLFTHIFPTLIISNAVKGNADSEFVGEKTVKVKVTVSYDYGTDRVHNLDIKVKQKAN